MVPRSLAGSLAAGGLAAALVILPGPTHADSVYFGFSSGYGHRHYHRHHHHHPHWPRYYSGYYYAPPVYYPPPPPQVVYVPAPQPAPLVAAPTSPAYRTSDGRYCREYQATVTVNGMPQPSYGTACLMPDGAWRVVN